MGGFEKWYDYLILSLSIKNLALWFSKGDPGTNRFGPSPLQKESSPQLKIEPQTLPQRTNKESVVLATNTPCTSEDEQAILEIINNENVSKRASKIQELYFDRTGRKIALAEIRSLVK